MKMNGTNEKEKQEAKQRIESLLASGIVESYARMNFTDAI